MLIKRHFPKIEEGRVVYHNEDTRDLMNLARMTVDLCFGRFNENLHTLVETYKPQFVKWFVYGELMLRLQVHDITGNP